MSPCAVVWGRSTLGLSEPHGRWGEAFPAGTTGRSRRFVSGDSARTRVAGRGAGGKPAPRSRPHGARDAYTEPKRDLNGSECAAIPAPASQVFCPHAGRRLGVESKVCGLGARAWGHPGASGPPGSIGALFIKDENKPNLPGFSRSRLSLREQGGALRVTMTMTMVTTRPGHVQAFAVRCVGIAPSPLWHLCLLGGSSSRWSRRLVGHVVSSVTCLSGVKGRLGRKQPLLC